MPVAVNAGSYVRGERFFPANNFENPANRKDNIKDVQTATKMAGPSGQKRRLCPRQECYGERFRLS